MALQDSLEYYSRRDVIDGFIDYVGKGSTEQRKNQAFVLYYFVNGSSFLDTSVHALEVLLKDSQLNVLGVKLKVITCDMSSPNQSLFKKL